MNDEERKGSIMSMQSYKLVHVYTLVFLKPRSKLERWIREYQEGTKHGNNKESTEDQGRVNGNTSQFGLYEREAS